MANFSSTHGSSARTSSGCAPCGNARQEHGYATCSSAICGSTKQMHGLDIGEFSKRRGDSLIIDARQAFISSAANNLSLPYIVRKFIECVRVRVSSTFNDNFTTDNSAVKSLHPALRNIIHPVMTTGNGDCFYNALSLTYFGNEESSVWFRLGIAECVLDNRMYFTNLLEILYPDGHRSLNDVVAKILTPKEWANEFVTLCACAMTMKQITMISDQVGGPSDKYATYDIRRVIRAMRRDQRYFGSSQIFNVFSDTSVPHIFMMHVNGNHYVSVLASDNVMLPFRMFQNESLISPNEITRYATVRNAHQNELTSYHSDVENNEECRESNTKGSILSGNTSAAIERENNIEMKCGEFTTTASKETIKPRKDRTAVERMKRLRSDPTYAAKERDKNKEKKKLLRSISRSQKKDAILESGVKLDVSPFSIAVEEFKSSTSQGPTHVCFVCHNLWFRHSIAAVKKSTFLKYNVVKEIELPDKISLCYTCHEKVRKGKLPDHSWINGKVFPDVSDVVKSLTPLEEILVSPRIPFMTIRPLGRDRQHGLRGAVVNVPIDVPETLTHLPRSTNDTHVLCVKLKRKKEYKSSFHQELIRPAVVLEAAKQLTESELYKRHEISFVPNWQDNNTEEKDPVDKDSCLDLTSEVEDDDHPLNPGGQQTLLSNGSDLILAPGEGKTPLSLIYDKDCEELCFPTLFGGNENPFKFMKPGERSKFMARHLDRRCSKIPYLFFVYKRLEMEKLNNIINVCVRKRKQTKLRARECLDNDFMNGLIQNDEGYKFMKSLRSSPAYWESKKKDVFAMIRQLGFPTLFMTFSAAESKWPDLIVILKKLVDHEDVSEEFAMNMTYNEKARLIRSDPITCSRFFENKFRNFLHKIILNRNGPFVGNPVKDYYVRFEFQHRGSVHAHMVVWLDNAPYYEEGNKLSLQMCENFIDTVITCKSDETLGDTLGYQQHKHSFTCRKSSNMKCRFGMPHFPMRQSKILEPLVLEKQDLNRNKKLVSRIKNGITNNEYENIDDMLAKHDLTYNRYISLIRSQLKRPKVFLKRSVDECFINAYNRSLLDLFQANMDIQFIVDSYSCVSYIIDYINKSNRGMSLLMRNLVRQLDGQNLSVKKKLQMLASKFINATEISAQEAAYHILELPLSKGSRQVTYINTSRPEERVKMLKGYEALQQLEEDSEDVFHGNVIDHYSERPDSLESLCLADFAANYNYSKCIRKRSEEDAEGKFIPLKHRKGYIRQRKNSKVIRYRRFCIDKDPIEYYRENIMLFTSWRDENDDILSKDMANLFEEKQDLIEAKRSIYIRSSIKDREEIEQSCNDDTDNDDADFGAYKPPDGISANIANDVPVKSDVPFRRTALINEQFHELVASLNERQYRYLLSLLSRLREGYVQDFITGGAGTGKSKLIEAISALIDRYYNIITLKDHTPTVRCIICAPTGKAAYNVKGLTLHSAFCLPVTQNKEAFHLLSADKLNTLRCKLHGLKFIIIDEISMVGSTLFEQVESRLRQIFDSTKQFGGINIIVVGDFTQLKPVCDSYIFQGSRKNPYNALVTNALWENFNLFELTEIMRQKGDVPFAQALQHFASCDMSDFDVKLLQSRIVDSAPESAVHLYTNNEDVDSHNRVALEKLETFGIISQAHDTCYGDATENVKEGYLKSLRSCKASETSGLHTSVNLKISAKYMITDNLDVEDGLVNGAIGKLVHVTLDISNTKAMIAWIRFDDASIGIKARSKCKQSIPDYVKGAIPILRVTHLISNKGYHKQLQMYRSQFPLVPAQAITIHKSQGSTYKEVAYHIGRFTTHSSAYVALSRSTCCSGLYIIGEFKIFTSPNSIITKELTRLRSKPAAIEFEYMLKRNKNHLKIVSFNIQSINPHLNSVLKDPCLNNSDIICLVETWTIPQDKISIPSFRVVARIDSGKFRKPNGVIILARFGVTCVHIADHVHNTLHSALQASTVLLNGQVYVITLYIPPNTHTRLIGNFVGDCLEKISVDAKIVITGDFNQPIHSLRNLLYAQFPGRNITHRNSDEPSTYLSTQIDHTFSNAPSTARYYESFVSYHRPQVILVTGCQIRGQKCFSRKRIKKTLRTRITIRISKRLKVNHGIKYPHVYNYHYRYYLRALCRKRNRHKIKLPQHEQYILGCTR